LEERVWIAADVELQTDTRVQIGAGTSVQRRCTINGSTRVGRGCILAPGVFISSGTHPFRAIAHLPIREQEQRLAQDEEALSQLDRPIWVQDDCWLGVNAVVCPGVTIGKGSVVGANAVVTRDVPPYSVVAGSPARIIGTRLDWKPPARLDPSREEDHPYLLEATLSEPPGERCIEVSVGSPLLVALKAPVPGGNVSLIWRAVQPASLQIGGRRVELPAGQGTLALTEADLQIAAGVARCAVRLAADASTRARVDIVGIHVLQA
jgi:acetyltransferase-like isoleucine patch superfamily enzyme